MPRPLGIFNNKKWRLCPFLASVTWAVKRRLEQFRLKKKIKQLEEVRGWRGVANNRGYFGLILSRIWKKFGERKKQESGAI